MVLVSIRRVAYYICGRARVKVKWRLVVPGRFRIQSKVGASRRKTELCLWRPPLATGSTETKVCAPRRLPAGSENRYEHDFEPNEGATRRIARGLSRRFFLQGKQEGSDSLTVVQPSGTLPRLSHPAQYLSCRHQNLQLLQRLSRRYVSSARFSIATSLKRRPKTEALRRKIAGSSSF